MAPFIKSTLFLVAICAISGCRVNSIEATDPRTTVVFNRDWLFQIGDAPINEGWESINLPHTPQIEPLVVNNQWQGVCWYKKTIPTSSLPGAKKHFLHFEAVMQECTVWVNGTEVTHHKGGYLPFSVDLSSNINLDLNEQTVLVKVANTDDATIPPGKPLKELDFNMYGGIYRNVHLISTQNTYITDAVHANQINGGGVLIHFDTISNGQATGFVKVHIQNDDSTAQDVKVEIRLKKDQFATAFTSEAVSLAANAHRHVQTKIAVSNPDLWTPEAPHIYAVEVKLLNAKTNECIDLIHLNTGIRKIELNKDGFFLNGQKRFINGTNRHQEYPYTGYAITDNANYRDAYLIKQAGFDFVRLSHYPQSTAFLDACDEIGIMVMTCIPGWQFFEEGKFAANALQDVKDFIRRDRNHPSIVFWENSLNESWMKGGFVSVANKVAKAEMPYTDFYTAGWVDEMEYDLFIPARQHAAPPHYWNNYEKDGRKILIAEYGDWEYYAQNAGFDQKEFKNLKEEERTSRQLRAAGEKRLLQQALNFQEAFNSNLQGKNTIGHANWLMFDYNRGYANDIEASGIADIFRIPKYAFYFYQSQKPPRLDSFSQPNVHIASHWSAHSSATIKVFSNCEQVALYVNDSLFAIKSAQKDANSSHLAYPPFMFDVGSYSPGTIKAVGLIDGKPAAEHRVSMAASAHKLRITIGTFGKEATPETDDILFVYVSVLDANNNPVFDASPEITLSAHNNLATIIGPTTTQAEAGIATFLLRTNYTGETIILRAQAADLASDTIQIF